MLPFDIVRNFLRFFIFLLVILAFNPGCNIKAESGDVGDSISKDPFTDLELSTSTPTRADSDSISPQTQSQFFSENFTFKKELYSQLSYGPELQSSEEKNNDYGWYSRQSLGFEVLKKFSTANSTIASFDFQGRLVRRDNFIPVLNDEEGAGREGWYFEYHNLYLDFYNILNPLLSDSARGPATGHFNFRLGRFYLPFGLNLQTDTHGTLLQLSNERNFGFERDWYAGFLGSINRDFNYDLYYLLGSGYDPTFKGQDGLVGGRVSLANTYLNEYGFEGGLSALAGQRTSKHSLERSPTVQSQASSGEFIQTQRVGLDTRYTHLVTEGSLTSSAEISTGKDESEDVFTQLYQLDYLHHSRKWGVSSQYRTFQQNFSAADAHQGADSDTSVIGELTWFFRNDIGNTNLHWVKLNIERQLQRMEGSSGTVTTLQYYRYW